MLVPQRRFGGVVMTRVAYASNAFGPIGWLVRHGRRGAPPLEAIRIAADTRPVFDHAEAWLRIDDYARHLDDRILIGHPYRFDEEMRAALARAAVRFGFMWTAIPPGGAPVPSWYDRSAWLIIAHPPHLLPVPDELEIPSRRKQVRRPLRPGETITDMQSEAQSEQAKLEKKRAYNRARYHAQKIKRRRPQSLGDILADPERARAQLRDRE